MKRTNIILLVILILAVVLVGGGVIYTLNRSVENTTDNQGQVQSENQQPITDQPVDQPEAAEVSEETEMIQGIEVPVRVLGDIERDYPEYAIDDVDRETRAGQIYYEIDLEHRDPANQSEYELTYDDSWSLIDSEFDED